MMNDGSDSRTPSRRACSARCDSQRTPSGYESGGAAKPPHWPAPSSFAGGADESGGGASAAASAAAYWPYAAQVLLAVVPGSEEAELLLPLRRTPLSSSSLPTLAEPCLSAGCALSLLGELNSHLAALEEGAPPAQAFARARARYLRGWVPVIVYVLAHALLPPLLAPQADADAGAAAAAASLRRLAAWARWACEYGLGLAPCVWAFGLLSTRARDKRARRLGLVTLAHCVLSFLALCAALVGAPLEQHLSASLALQHDRSELARAVRAASAPVQPVAPS
jgi:hypothetical protein